MFSVFVVKANKYFKAGVGKFLLVLLIRQKIGFNRVLSPGRVGFKVPIRHMDYMLDSGWGLKMIPWAITSGLTDSLAVPSLEHIS